ncbi:M1 family metallopeptidase [Parahaliea mediterranea]|uniref:Aminopeptidase n=1 Tax=Parahaliea mediterranea TaxID=651086 RepID=A0A939DBG1_9GAMM|nr:M1 family metallopeptidase [Parahaliea mediterranea]MBN7795081.1 ERAP1-like C-terminal domain-containing protein [Parahaliea mediterranea]
MPSIFRVLTVFMCLASLAACDRVPRQQAGAAPPGAPVYLADEHEAPRGKLPSLARPLAYRLDLRVDPRAEGLSGSARIDLELLRPSDVIWLHGKDLAVSRIRAVLAGGEAVAATYEQVLDTGVAAVRLAAVVPAGELSLEIDYAAHYSRTLVGLFKVEEQGDAYVLAKSESIQARRFLPGFDEPGLKATFDWRLTVPAGYPVIGNTAELDRAPAGEGMETVTFATSPPMPTYLLSLAVGPFDVVERPALPANAYRDAPVPLRGFARRGRGAGLDYILDITPRMVEIFETQLERPYPFGKLDIVAAPQWPSGATELSAAPTYHEQLILVGGDPSPGERLTLLSEHAHEIAHMWFGNLVTPPWWDDLWLKEGFATWGTPLALAAMEPEAGHELAAAARAIDAMRLDSLASTRAIREPIDDNENVRNAYDAITYQKSLGVIRMVDRYFGPETFRPALGRYVGRYAGGSADAAQFYAAIAEATRTPALTAVFRDFVEQKGVPVVDVALRCGEGAPAVTLRESRYKPLGSTIDAHARWSIPLCLRTDDGARHCEMLVAAEQTVTLPRKTCPDWVLPNAGGDGYYRWNLPPAQWRALLADFDQLGPAEALSLVDSALAAFEAGQLPPALVWEVVAASAVSSAPRVVSAPLHQLQRYSRHYLDAVQRTTLAGNLRRWYGPAIDRAKASESPEAQLLHTELLGLMALEAQDTGARRELRTRAVDFTGFGGPRDPGALASELYEAALTVAVQDLGQDFVEHLIELRRDLDDPRFAAAAASALGRVSDPELLPTVWALALSGELNPREVSSLLHSATAPGETQEANWQWIRDNFPQIVALIPTQWRRRLPELAADFCSEAALQQLRALFNEYAELAPGHRRALTQTQERIQLCLAQAGRGEVLAETL